MFKSLNLYSMLKHSIGVNKRGMWKWIDDTFNALDDDRIKEVGPNIACAEWLMKNGAQVRWKGCKTYVDHYDCLPTNIDFTEDCKNISSISFIGCHPINNEAISELKILKDYLTTLEINDCCNVSDEGILALENISSLKHLKLRNIKYKNQRETISHIKAKLPKCNIIYHDYE